MRQCLLFATAAFTAAFAINTIATPLIGNAGPGDNRPSVGQDGTAAVDFVRDVQPIFRP